MAGTNGEVEDKPLLCLIAEIQNLFLFFCVNIDEPW